MPALQLVSAITIAAVATTGGITGFFVKATTTGMAVAGGTIAGMQTVGGTGTGEQRRQTRASTAIVGAILEIEIIAYVCTNICLVKEFF